MTTYWAGFVAGVLAVICLAITYFALLRGDGRRRP